MAATPIIEAFFEPYTSSLQYLVACPSTGACAVIDPVWGLDEKSGAMSAEPADLILKRVSAKGWRIQWILDTHPHADHLSAAHYLHRKTGAPTGIGREIPRVQALWKDIYQMSDVATDGSQWDRLFADGDIFNIGEIEVRVRYSPGHTAASISYQVGDALFVHDTLFMPDSGTARADFPGGSAAELWRSIAAIMTLPDSTRLFTGHDYQPEGRPPRWESTVAEQRSSNIHLLQAPTEDKFVAFRQTRDRILPMPRLILHALQVNIRGGRLPDAENGGRQFLKFPLDTLPNSTWS